MTQDRATPSSTEQRSPYQRILASSYYGLLGVHPSASVRDIRKAYRDLSKQYHPDTTSLPREVATVKFQQLNEAYATLSNPERRLVYDRKIGYSRVTVSQPLPSLNRSVQPRSSYSSSAYLDPTDRPLSAGEVFALFILAVTFLACLILAITIGLTKGEAVFQPQTAQTQPNQQMIAPERVLTPEAISPAPARPTTRVPDPPAPKLEAAPKVETLIPPAPDAVQPVPELVDATS